MGRRERTTESADHAGYRHARLEALIRDELAGVLSDEVDDPALDDVKVAHVTVSVDYRHAKVYFDVAPERRQLVERALERAAGFLRARIADAVDLKRVPELRFVHYV